MFPCRIICIEFRVLFQSLKPVYTDNIKINLNEIQLQDYYYILKLSELLGF